MKQIDVSDDKFDFLDCSEGNIFFNQFDKNDKLKISIWGVTLMHELGFENDKYVADKSILIFKDANYISMNYSLYETDDKEFVKDINGNEKTFQKTFGHKEDIIDCFAYILGGVLDNNVGFGELTIYCKGEVNLYYNESALVDVREYCINSSKYRYKCKLD